jgi:hypothetical protein
VTKRSIEDVLGAIKVPVRSVSICLDADLQGEHDELSEQLERLRRDDKASGKMATGGEILRVAEQIRELEDRMRESEQVFKFRGLSRAARKKLEAKFPPPDPNPENLRWNVDEGAPTLLAEAAIQPTMNVSQARSLLDSLAEGQADRLVGCAWLATTASTTVPFSARASELTAGTGSN